MMTELTLIIPEPAEVDQRLTGYNSTSDIKRTIKLLEDGKPVLISTFYSDGLTLVHELQKHLRDKFSNESFQEQREYRAAFRTLSNLIFLEIANHKLAVKKAPTIGWIEKFYPENSQFYLSFPQVQGLNSAWQWHIKGIQLPVLRNKIHPYYGVYFPTRFDHLILFDNWLKRYEGAKKTAIDVGVGCGVLSFQLVKHGFQKVFATDTNPNAIVGLSEFMGETKLSRKIMLDYGPLFAQWEKPSELIVFNPPWMPAPDGLEECDEAIYYDEQLFPSFFAEAKKRLLPDGKLVMMFSNIAKITHLTEEHPIEKELASGGRFKLEKCLKKSVKVASDKTKRNQYWREKEEVELWILTHK